MQGEPRKARRGSTPHNGFNRLTDVQRLRWYFGRLLKNGMATAAATAYPVATKHRRTRTNWTKAINRTVIG